MGGITSRTHSIVIILRKKLKSKYVPGRSESVAHKTGSQKMSPIEMSIKNTTENVLLSARQVEANVEITDEQTYVNTALLGES